jgi:uncharacterized protein YbjT (DUF2867 family)
MFLVTGASGNCGKEVARALVDSGAQVTKASSRACGEGIDFLREATWSAAKDAVVVLIVRPPSMSDVGPILPLH